MLSLLVVLNYLNDVAFSKGEWKERLSSLRGGRGESSGDEVTNGDVVKVFIRRFRVVSGVMAECICWRQLLYGA